MTENKKDKIIILRMPDPAELEIEEQINGMCQKLHIMPPPVLRLKMEVFQDGEKISHYEDRARSWVRNYYNWMAIQTLGLGMNAFGTTYGAGYTVMKRINGTNDTGADMVSARAAMTAYGVGYHYRGAGASTSIGIVVGTGDTAESFEHHALATLIAEGTGTGQLNYVAMDNPVTSWDGVTKKFTQKIARFINNNSGGSITVNEAGLYCALYSTSPSATTTQQYMLARDLVSPGVDVVNTAQLKVTYTIESATYPV